MKNNAIIELYIRHIVCLLFLILLIISAPLYGQIPEGQYEGEDPNVSFTVANQTTITNFTFWVSWPAGSCGGKIPISRSSIAISDTSFSINYNSSSRKYTVDGIFKCDSVICGGTYYMWDKDP